MVLSDSERRFAANIFRAYQRIREENERPQGNENSDSQSNKSDSHQRQHDGFQRQTQDSRASEPVRRITLPISFECIQKILWIILWLTLFYLFIKLEFGTVYFIVTLIMAIYFSTSTRPILYGEMSAYSVFNENCQRICGTQVAE